MQVQAQDPANGRFEDHGVAAPVGQAVWGGPVAAVDKDGRPVILMKLWVCSGTKNSTYLFIDAKTGRYEQVDPEIDGYGAYATFLSRANKFYDTLGEHFTEVDVATRRARRVGKVPERFAMSFTEDDDGVIYAGMMPNAELVAYDPEADEVTNYGPLAEEDWPQYPHVAADDAGWVYAAIRFKRGNLVAFHPETGEKRQLIDEKDRRLAHEVLNWRARQGGGRTAQRWRRSRCRTSMPGSWIPEPGGLAGSSSITTARAS